MLQKAKTIFVYLKITRQQILQKFYQKTFSKKRFCLLALGIVLFFALVPLPTNRALAAGLIVAGIVSAVTSLIVAGGTAVGIIAGFFIILYLISAFLLDQGTVILSWALSSPFDLSMTSPTGNFIIYLGWTLLRDFTNMLFILGLAYIGLATALDIAGFDTKKTFINLLLIALLINFTPVICGVVVDISNIITDFLVKGVDLGGMLAVMNDNFNIEALGGFGVGFTRLICGIAFTFFSGLIIMTFAGLFLFRHVAIWLLVIFSPLAFFAWIFPKTKNYFDKWWRWFLQWSFIGVPAGFILYLAHHLVDQANNNKILQYAYTDSSNGFFAKLAPYFIVTMFLYAGLGATKYLTPIGAGAIFGFMAKVQGKATGAAKKYGKKLGAWAGIRGAGAGVGTAEGAKEQYQKAKAGGAGFWKATGAGFGGAIGGWARGVATKEGEVAGKKKFMEAAEKLHLAKAGATEKYMAGRYKVSAAEKDLKQASTPKLERVLSTWAVTDEAYGRQMAAAKILAERKKLKKTKSNIEKIKKLQTLGFDTKAAKTAITSWTAELADKEKLDKKAATLFGVGSTFAGTTTVQQTQIKNDINAEAVRDMNPRSFRDVQFKDMGAEITHVDIAKIKDIGRNAKKSEKQEFRKNLIGQILSQAKVAKLAGNTKERKRLNNLYKYIKSEPNFKP